MHQIKFARAIIKNKNGKLYEIYYFIGVYFIFIIVNRFYVRGLFNSEGLHYGSY